MIRRCTVFLFLLLFLCMPAGNRMCGAATHPAAEAFRHGSGARLPEVSDCEPVAFYRVAHPAGTPLLLAAVEDDDEDDHDDEDDSDRDDRGDGDDDRDDSDKDKEKKDGDEDKIDNPDDGDPPADDEPDPPADDPDSPDGDKPDPPDDDRRLEGNYHVRVANRAGADIEFWFGLDTWAYPNLIRARTGEETLSTAYPTLPGFHVLFARWHDPGDASWHYDQQSGWIGIDDDREFAFIIGPIHRTVVGRVVHDGHPIDGARVDLLAAGSADPRGTDVTGRDGRFSIDRLENGRTYSLAISRAGYREVRHDLGRVTRDIDAGDIVLTPVGGDGGDDSDGSDDDPDDDDPVPPADTDGDGVPDGADAFPDDPGEVSDNDGDGTGDNADTDDDDDGMPDDWEQRYGLDPEADDADADPDGDGVSNRDEYAGGTDPGVYDENVAPDAPVPVSPADGAAGLPLAAVLETGEFTDRDGDGHRATRWQIGEHPGFAVPAFDRECDRHLTRLEVPNLVLSGERTYYWRVRFIDDRGVASAWSETAHFTTGPWAADANRDGIADAFEFTGHSDMDGDGTADQEQADMRCLYAVTGKGRYLGIGCPDNGQIECLECIDPAAIGETEERPDPARMPFGMVNFRVGVSAPGEAIRLTVYFSEPLRDPAEWYKYSAMDGWLDLTGTVTLSEDRRSVAIEIRDGGPGDVDGVANGVIVDPSGVVAATIGRDDDDDDEGKWHVSCFIGILRDGPGK